MAHTPNPLERFVDRTLRDLPLHRAPASLEHLVLERLADRAAQPWWRQSFRQWPSALRIAFLTVSASVAALALALGFALARNGFGNGFSRWSDRVSQQASTLKSLGAAYLPHLETHAHLWLTAAGVCVVAMLATTIGLGAAAYRLLWKTA